MALIKLTNSKAFDSIDGLSILDSGRAQGVILEHSCRTGRCGVCRVRLKSGETRIQVPEQSITQAEIDDGFILTCSRGAVSDLEIEAADLGRLADLKIQTLPARIESLTQLAPDVLEVMLRIPPAQKFEFLPGQYINLIGPGGVRRSYSIANAPRMDGRITLNIRRVFNGELSAYWFEQAKLNDLLRFEGPLGTFFLRDNSSSRLVLLATGTGIAPIKAILEELQADRGPLSFEHIHLYWGGRHLPDLYWQPVFGDLAMTYTPVLSRGLAAECQAGYVQDVVLSDEVPLENAVVYACGSEAMIRDALKALAGAGLCPNNFYSDAFVPSGVVSV